MLKKIKKILSEPLSQYLKGGQLEDAKIYDDDGNMRAVGSYCPDSRLFEVVEDGEEDGFSKFKEVI